MKALAAVRVAALAITLAIPPVSAFSAPLAPVETVAQVNLDRYLGLWHEIARYPNVFQKGCVDSSTTYSRRPDGDIEVHNVCRNADDGKLREVKGRAWVADPRINARLKVSFFWPFRSDYWIIDLGKEYDYAVVGTPNRKSLWVLSRTPAMSEEVYEGIVRRLEKQGFDRAKLVRGRK